jgi:transcription initiation factor IIE alpha subunit
MSQKITFDCSNCETRGTIRLGDDFDDAKVTVCPVCGDPLDMDDGDEDLDD